MSCDTPVEYEAEITSRLEHPMKRVTGIGGISFKAAEGGNVLDKIKVVARCRPEDQPGLLKLPHVTLMNFTGRVMKGWLYVTGPSTKKVAGLRTSIARGETALGAPTRKPGGGTR